MAKTNTHTHTHTHTHEGMAMCTGRCDYTKMVLKAYVFFLVCRAHLLKTVEQGELLVTAKFSTLSEKVSSIFIKLRTKFGKV